MGGVGANRLLLLLALGLGGVLAPGLAAQARGSEADAAASAALIERITALQRSVTTMSGHAVWRTRHGDEPAAAARVQEVQFALLFPDKYKLVFSSAGDSDTRLVVRCDGVTREELQYQFKDEPPDRKRMPVGKDDQQYARLLSWLRLDLPALGRDFTIQAVATASSARLTLAPARADIAEQIAGLSILFDAGSRIAQLDWSDPQGNRYDVIIDQAVYDKPILPQTFQVTSPGDATAPGK